MCLPKQLCAALHVLWSLVYVGAGSVQLVAGIFFFISLPVFRVGSNIWTGAWNIVVGVGAGMLSCVGDLNYKRQEALLFLAVSLLAVNVVNAVLLEVGEWHFFLSDSARQVIAQKSSRVLVFYAHVTTSVSTAVAIVISFLDIQLTYCSMQRTRETKNVHEQVSDIEYIIPRKPNTVAKQAHSIYSQYAQSWVFDTDTTGSSKNDSPYLKLPHASPQEASKTATIRALKSAVVEVAGEAGRDPTMFLVNPVVHVETVEDEAEGARTLNYMKSFSRTPSPVVLSASSSPDSGANNNPPIYECLERLTEPALYRSRLNTALSLGDQPSTSRERRARPRSETFTAAAESLDASEKVQYASLLLELQQALRSKKDRGQQPGSPQSSTLEDVSKASSPGDDKKGSDAEFSKELEAALQLIQDLESPNTVETPSEACRSLEGVEVMPAVICVRWRDGSGASESECVSPAGPVVDLPEESRRQQQQQGKTTSVVVVAPSGSESSSGYSSPSPGTSKRPTPVCSNPPSVKGSADDLIAGRQAGYAIRNTGAGAVITLFSPAGAGAPSPGSSNASTLRLTQSPQSTLSSTGSSRWNVKSLLKRKPSQLTALPPELEGAIIKSESLAYLTDLELLARHARNKSIQRQIEQRVHQKIMGLSPSESSC
ncbi:uncharacterized protein LOC134541079 isoform X2 [Bacillus rossius redtenbacheri]|uniref:uncharacterized protein LOC134541079 isoform X2 n=1 Tax=Bacillus rossius redtenbacheri TaxID=93214 RepID=UPI002FDEA0BA